MSRWSTVEAEVRDAGRVAKLVELGVVDRSSGHVRAGLDEELRPLVAQAVRATGMARGAVNLLDGTYLHALGASGFGGGRVTQDGTVCAEVTGRAPNVYAFTDLAEEPGFRANPYVDGRRARVRAYASAPVVVSGTVVGTLCVADDEPRAVSLEACDRLGELAAVVATVVGRSATSTATGGGSGRAEHR